MPRRSNAWWTRAPGLRHFFFLRPRKRSSCTAASLTWEYDPQLYFKRAQASKPLAGQRLPGSLRERIARALLAGLNRRQ